MRVLIDSYISTFDVAVDDLLLLLAFRRFVGTFLFPGSFYLSISSSFGLFVDVTIGMTVDMPINMSTGLPIRCPTIFSSL